MTDNLDDFYTGSHQESWIEFIERDDNKRLTEISISCVDEKQPIEIMYTVFVIHPRKKIYYTDQNQLPSIIKYLNDIKINYRVEEVDKLKATCLVFDYQERTKPWE